MRCLKHTTIITTLIIQFLVPILYCTPQHNYQNALKNKLNALRQQTVSAISSTQKALHLSQQTEFPQEVKKMILLNGLKQAREYIITGMEESAIPFFLKGWNCTHISAENQNAIRQRNNKLLTAQRKLENELKDTKSNSCPQTDQIDELQRIIKVQVERIDQESKQYCVQDNPTPEGSSKNTSSEQQSIESPSNTNSDQSNTSSASGDNGSSKSNKTGGNNEAETGNQQGNKGNEQGKKGNQSGNKGSQSGETRDEERQSVPVYLNNLQNSENNWVFGKMKLTQFYGDVNKKLKNGGIICPKSTPYLSPSGQCTTCNDIYDVALQQCASCPSGSSLNTKIHQCDTTTPAESLLLNSNSQVDNYIGTPQHIKNAASCSIKTPYFDGDKCVSCSLPNYFDADNHLCLACGMNLTFDSSLKSCRPPNNSVNAQVTIYNSDLTQNNYVGQPPYQITDSPSCPSSQPYFNGLNCISCSLPLFFNFTGETCSSCQAHYKFDPTQRGCQVDEKQVYYSSLLDGVNNHIGSPPAPIQSQQQLIKTCPQDRPFSKGRQCIACPLPRFFNFQTNHCELCNSPMKFNVNVGGCETVYSDSKGYNSNLEEASNFMYKMPAYRPLKQQCPVNAPYFNGNSCTQCLLPAYFNFKTFLCQSCPSGLSFNSNSRQCTTDRPSHATDLTNPNIYYNGDFQHLMNQIKTQQLQQDIPKCPQDSPFYDATHNECITCPKDHPLFNIKYNTCTRCQQGSQFDPISRICRYQQRVNLSLARNFMNTIGF